VVEVMAIVNLTPDSFAGDGHMRPISAQGVESAGQAVDTAVQHALRAAELGAAWVDLGAESSRPGAIPVSEDQELQRLVPVLRTLARERARRSTRTFRISVDTMKPAVMAKALDEGADMLNDVNGFRAPGAWPVAVQAARICMVHMLGTPRTMQYNPTYPDSYAAYRAPTGPASYPPRYAPSAFSANTDGVVDAVRLFLAERIDEGCRFGLDPARVVVDPGIGFGKTLEHNLMLMQAVHRLQWPHPDRPDRKYPVLIGASRKRMIGELTGKPVEQRCAGSIGAAIAASEAGASILRVHDVDATVDALRVYWACRTVREADVLLTR